MAIPNSPDWSDLTEPKEYPAYSGEPNKPNFENYFISIGPVDLSDSTKGVNQRYWLLTQENGSIYIRGADSGNDKK